MIRVRKSRPAPASLKDKKRYNRDDVRRRLSKDQHGKCFLCECKAGRFFQVEHLKSQTKFPQYKFAWSNLFLSCPYCNGKKSDNYNTIANPAKLPRTDSFEILCNFENKLVDITLLQPIDGGEETVELLQKIHNGSGKPGFRTYSEERFYEEFSDALDVFTQDLLNYMSSRTAENKKKLKGQLRPEAPFLAAKRSHLRRDAPDLYNELC